MKKITQQKIAIIKRLLELNAQKQRLTRYY